jgi:hypothetical protein
MEIIYLRAYGSGYRGCVARPGDYLFFQYGRRKGLKALKRYPKTDFEDLEHFMAMMQKFISPPAFLVPPVPIAALTLEELDRIHRRISQKDR